jgi:hypothetical protein
MAEVMSELDAASDQLLYEDGELQGRAKDVKEVEKRPHHKRNSDNTSCQSPEVCTSTYQYIPVYTSMYQHILILDAD